MADESKTEAVVENETSDQTQTTDWLAELPDDLKSNATLTKFTDVPSLASSYVELEKRIGGDSLILPGPNATDDEKSAFFSKIGRPDTAEAYELPKEGMPEGFQVDDKRLSSIRDKAFALGVTKQQFAGLIRADAEYQHGAVQEFEQAQKIKIEESTQALMKEYGAAFDQNITLATAAVREFGGQELVDRYAESGEGRNADTIKAWLAVAKAIANDEVLGTGSSTKFALSPGEAESEIVKLMTDEKFQQALYDKNDPGHKPALEKWAELNKAAAPEKPVETF